MVKRSREDFDLLPADEASDSPATESPPSTATSDLRTIAHDKVKIAHIDTESGEASILTEVMRCSLPPHRQTIPFTSFEDYEVHYNKNHVNRCSECRKNFPTTHFLDLHISENHDPLVEVQRDRGERTYSCFVEDCDRKCSTPNKRRMHLIDKHMFPKDYDFYIVNDGIDQRSSMLRSGRHRRRSSAVQHKSEIADRARKRSSAHGSLAGDHDTIRSKVDAQEDIENIAGGRAEIESTTITSNKQSEMVMNELVGAMSSLKFVPPSVRFGRGRGKGGFSRG